MRRKGNHNTLLVRIKLVQSLWKKSMEIPQNTKNRSTVWFSNSSPLYISKKMKTLKDKHTLIFISASIQSLSHVPLCNPVDCNTPGFLVHHQLWELAQTQVHRVTDAIQPSHHLSSPSPPTFNLSQHQGLFKWVSSSHQVAKVLELQLQRQFFQWIFRTDFL